MTIECEVDRSSPAEWAEIGRHFLDHSIYQTWAFGEVSAADTGSRISRAIVREGGDVIGAAQVRIKKIPFLNTGLAYIYFGPMSRRRDSRDRFSEVLSALREEFATRQGLGLRIVANRWKAAPDSGGDLAREAGFTVAESIPAYRTILVELSGDSDTLRKNLAQKWRNGLNQAEKRGVVVEVRTDDDAMGEFERLYEQMWSRKQFETGVEVSSFGRLQRLLSDPEKLSIHMAYKDGAFVAGHVSSLLGDTCIYLLGASNDAGRECKASYALQWQAMTSAKNAGAGWYDVGGIDPVANPGVYHFKSGLGGVETVFNRAMEAPVRGVGRYLIPLAERVYRALRPTGRNGQHQTHQSENKEETAACPSVAKLSS